MAIMVRFFESFIRGVSIFRSLSREATALAVAKSKSDSLTSSA
ncbi:MAG: hypothetical protein RLZZ212_206, partial [Actinomycetota bacterium]